MNRQEAITAMSEGKKVRHRYFSPEEWVTVENNHIRTEEDYYFKMNEFLQRRHGAAWETDWELVEEPSLLEFWTVPNRITKAQGESDNDFKKRVIARHETRQSSHGGTEQ